MVCELCLRKENSSSELTFLTRARRSAARPAVSGGSVLTVCLPAFLGNRVLVRRRVGSPGGPPRPQEALLPWTVPEGLSAHVWI